MPGAVEFPKFAYRKDAKNPLGYATRRVDSQQEQEALTAGWLTDPKDIHELIESLMPKPEEAEEGQIIEEVPKKKARAAK